MEFRGRTSCVRLNINEGILYREDGVNRKRLRLHIYCMSFGRWESNDINLDGVHPPLWPSFFSPLLVVEAWERTFHRETSCIAPEGEISTTSKELSPWTAFWEMVLLTTEK